MQNLASSSSQFDVTVLASHYFLKTKSAYFR